jgi:HK97 family phage major capsid protein
MCLENEWPPAPRSVDQNTGDKWPRVSAKFEALERKEADLRAQMDREQTELDRQAAAAFGASNNGEWRNARTGEPIRVVGREHVGKMRDALGITGTVDYSIADFFRGVAGLRTTESVRNALSVGTDGSGGYAVPSVLFGDFIDALVPASSVLQAGARVIKLDQSGRTFRFARVSSVPTAAWRSEAGAVAESDPAFTALDLTPQSLAFFFRVSRELLADAPGLDQLLLRVIAQAFAKEMDRAALPGTGTAPEIRGLSNIVRVGAVTNGAAGATLATIKWANLNSAYQTILEANGPVPTAAIMAPRTLVGFAGLADTTGQPLRRPALLDPMEFIATSQIPINLTVGASTDCTELFCGTFQEFVLGIREDVTIVRADQTHVGTGQGGFYCFARVDVGAVHPASFVKITGVRA